MESARCRRRLGAHGPRILNTGDDVVNLRRAFGVHGARLGRLSDAHWHLAATDSARFRRLSSALWASFGRALEAHGKRAL